MYLQCGADTMKPFMKIFLSTSYLTFEKKRIQGRRQVKVDEVK